MTKEDVNLALAFKMPPERAVKYLENKGYKISNNWYDMWEDAHAKAFTVAKMAKADLLRDTKEILENSLKNGTSARTTQKEVEKLFIEKGWWGKREVEDKNGEKKTIQLGSKYRVKTIYKQNIQSAYNAGRYLEQLENADIAPYLQYVCVIDSVTRPEHKALHQKIFRYDDEFWLYFYPPNGWGCRCTVRSLSASKLKHLGLTVEKSSGNISHKFVVVDKETGLEKPVAVYDYTIGGKRFKFAADAGWSTNPGKCAWGLDVQAYSKIKDLPQNLKDTFISEMAQNLHNSDVCNTFISNVIKSGFKTRGIEKTVTWINPDILNALHQDNIKPQTPIIVLQDNRIGHIIGNVKIEKQKLSDGEMFDIYNIINNPDEVYIDYTSKNATGLIYIKNIENNKCIKVCTKLNKLNKQKPVNYIATASIVNRNSCKNIKMYKKIK